MSAKNETLSVHFQEARALLGKLEYQRGNLEGALRVFDGIDLQATVQNIIRDKPPSKKGRTRSETSFAVSQHSTNLVLEAIYLKAKSLQKLGKLTEAAQECKSVLDAVEKIFVDGIPDVLVDNKLQETISHAVELLPELWKKAGCYSEAMSAYRRALLSQWNIDNECCARIQKAFAVFLLYSGVDFCAPSLSVQIDGSYIPRNNLEEAILLLMILLRKAYLEKICLELLKKSLNEHEAPNDVVSLLLAAKICSEDVLLATDGVKYAQRAIANANESNAHLKGVGLRMLGLCLGKQAKVSSSDFERSRLQSEALKSLDSAVALECDNPDLIFELGILYAEHRNLDAALQCAKQYLDRTGGSMIRGWRLLALVLSAQQRFSEAEVVTDAALDETSKWDQGPLLRMKAKLKISQSLHMDAVETYRYLLALVQAQKKSYGPLGSSPQVEHEKVDEYEVWHGLASLYASLSRWKDAEICLGKARALKHYSAETLHTEGMMHEKLGDADKALAAYINAHLLEPKYVPSKILIGSLLCKMGGKMLPVARTLLSDALRIEPTNYMAWYYLGRIHKDEGRIADALDCFQAASMLKESDPGSSDLIPETHRVRERRARQGKITNSLYTVLQDQEYSKAFKVEIESFLKARDDQLNKLHNKFQSTPASNEFEEQDFSVECNTSKGIPISTNGFISVEHVKNTVNEAIANAYDARAQPFKSYIKPYTKRIEQLRVPENYQPPKFQQFNGHGDPRQHTAHFVETCNNADSDGDLLVKQFVLSLKDAAFDWYIDLEANSIDSWDDLQNKFFNRFYSVRLELCIQGMRWELCYILQGIKLKTFGELVTRAHRIEMSFNCKEDECLVDVSEDDGEHDDATP
ncbi:UNVERIFIED_CONTAM: protein NPG1 [Sesamum radiatum]|uniref:Protein NPG1 n=1 Tax=Sesamum radiatum TaxID=300843 RepID=A0AAW2TWR4_SESRA